MPTPVYDLSPHQLEWLYNNQTLTGGEPLGEEGNCSLQQQLGSPTSTTQILFTDSAKLTSVPEVEHDDEEETAGRITEGIDSKHDMAAALARKRRSGEAINGDGLMIPNNQCPRTSTQKPQKQLLASLFPHTNERLTWEQSFANLQVYHSQYGVSTKKAMLLVP
jgi:hypothetical protein